MNKLHKRLPFLLLLVLLITFPALAAAPAEGLVVEGQSVPGFDLGDSRAQVEAAYGEPASWWITASITCRGHCL